MRTSVIRACNRLEIFRILSESPVPVSGVDLAKQVGADHALLRRMLRYLVSMYAVGEAGVDLYSATNITRNLTVPGLKAGVDHTFDTVGPPVMAMPAFLAKTNYQNPTDPKHCAFQDAHRTEDDVFAWFPKHPECLDNFNLWMAAQREGRAYWQDFFSFEDQIAKGFVDTGDGNAVMLVDTGGARGHEIQAIKSRFPNLPGKFILQDLPSTIAQALPIPDLVAMEHDFFGEQPVKGNCPMLALFALLLDTYW